MVTSKKADLTREDDERCELVDQLPQRAESASNVNVWLTIFAVWIAALLSLGFAAGGLRVTGVVGEDANAFPDPP